MTMMSTHLLLAANLPRCNLRDCHTRSRLALRGSGSVAGIVSNTENSGYKQAAGNKNIVWDQAGKRGLKVQPTAWDSETPVGEAF